MKHRKVDLGVDDRSVKAAMSQEICDFLDAYPLLNHLRGNRMAKNMSASGGDLHTCMFESPADDVSNSGALKRCAYAVAMTYKQPPLLCWRASATEI